MRYLLVDANHLASRCRWASGTHELSTSDGRRSAVVNGVLRSLSFVRNHLKIDQTRTICFWDGGRAQARMELYPAYKSGRQKTDPTPEEIEEKRQYYAQIDAVMTALQYLGIRQVKVGGTEADDLIAIYARFYAQHSGDVVIYSGDKDLHQCVDPNISIFYQDKDLLTVQQVLEMWTLPYVHLIPMVKALTGDSSDAIVGVPKIGPKRAAMIAPWQHLILSDSERPQGIDESVWKYIEIARSHQDIVIRNLKLMLLPRSFEDSYLSPEQAEQCVRQVRGDGMVVSMRKFLEFCREWELRTILEQIHYWQ